MTHVGFTGTQYGVSAPQGKALLSLLTSIKEEQGGTALHHGDCVGADALAHGFAVALGYHIVKHPPLVDTKQAFTRARDMEVRERKPYLDRNHDIVDESELLIAVPFGHHEIQRSGTWATVRYARKKGRRIFLITPDGRVHEEHNLPP